MTNTSEFTTSPATASLTYPHDVFSMQNTVSEQMNTFQTKYARYVRCQNENTAEKVDDPPCNLNGDDSFVALSQAYNNVYSSLEDMETVYEKQSKMGKDNETYETNAEEIEDLHAQILEVRQSLDDKLRYIQEQSDTRTAPIYRMLRGRTLINTLLVILLIYLVYILIFDMN